MENLPLHGGHTLVSKSAYLGTVVPVFALALITFALRMVIRIRQWATFHIDDYFHALAVVSLITSLGLSIPSSLNIYYLNDILQGKAPFPANYVQLASETALYGALGQTFLWTTIFAVKFSFLFAFRGLVRRLRKLEIIWWCTFFVCVPIAGTAIASPWIVCPYSGADLLTHCLSSSSFLQRENGMLYYGVVSDIVTDAMVVSIPILLLHQTTLSLRQKASIGTILCLSTFMVAIAIVRGISARVYGTGDQIWTAFWVQIEGCIATIMVSLSAFRQLFVAGAARNSGGRGGHPSQVVRGWKNHVSPTSAASPGLRPAETYRSWTNLTDTETLISAGVKAPPESSVASNPKRMKRLDEEEGTELL